MNHTVVSRPRWQSKLYRVNFFSTTAHATDIVSKHEVEILEKAGEEFSKTDIYKWVEENNVQLGVIHDDNQLSWHRFITFYGDVTEEQYTDYILRFSI